MKKIEFVGTIAPELIELMDKNNISAVCLDGSVCQISDYDLAKLKALAPAAFDGNDIIVLDD